MDEIVDQADIDQAQVKLVDALTKELPNRGEHLLGFRPGGKRVELFSKGPNSLYFATVLVDRPGTTRRYWNAFGFYDGKAHGAQRIALEINVASPSSRRAAAFFASDAQGDVFLLHDGKMGGGKEGVCRSGFLEHSGLEMKRVTRPGGTRDGLIIARLKGGELIDSISTFVRAAADYKSSLD